MAKKRGGGGSSPGLVITLVFFILATIGLGVATYYGFAEQDGLNKQIKDAKKTEDAFKAERDWYRQEAFIYKAYIGDMPENAEEKQDRLREKESLDKDKKNASFVKALPDTRKPSVDAAVAYVDTLKKEGFAWEPGEKEPSKTFKTRLKEKDTSYQEVAKMVAALEMKVKTAEKEAKDQERLANDGRGLFTKAVGEFEGKVKGHAKEYEDELKDARAKMRSEQALRADAVAKRDEAVRKLDAAEKDRDGLKTKLTKTTEDHRKSKLDVERLTAQNRVLRDKVKTDVGTDVAVEDTEITASRSKQKLRDWNHDWKIVSVERLGTVQRPLTYVYINLGSTQRVAPQLTFSVHGVEANGKLSPTPRGTIEVVRVVRANLSKALVTSEKDAKSDPIVKGNMIFNAIWDPTDQKRVAVVGLIDLAGDGTDGTSDFVRSLQRQGIPVDQYLDMDTLKTKGTGMTARTDYLIVGSAVEGTRHPKARDRAFSTAATKAMNDMRARARGLGVPALSLDRYMQLTGLPGGGRAAEDRPVGGIPGGGRRPGG